MSLFALDHHPRGKADTCFQKEKGVPRGNAACCPACGAAVSMPRPGCLRCVPRLTLRPRIWRFRLHARK